ncbi:MAG: response regulator transcription factor [Candidatus Aminicenantes bacterium]|nr:response regulator transcription factor [Candidatus Aminicenantes bacterium]
MSDKFKIALVEDDRLIGGMVKLNLEKSGYRAEWFETAELLLEQLRKELYDLFILDITLPGISGLELLKKLRSRDIDIPVLMLTVKNAVHDKINALDTGADDYLVKPFNMDELMSRVNALLRRSHGKRSLPSSRVLIINNFQIDFSTRKCDSNSGAVVLSEKEAKLLSYFAAHTGQTLSRADILEEVWGMDVSPTPRTIDNFVLKFRKLFERNTEAPEHFISVRNKGYRFEK